MLSLKGENELRVLVTCTMQANKDITMQLPRLPAFKAWQEEVLWCALNIVNVAKVSNTTMGCFVPGSFNPKVDVQSLTATAKTSCRV
jgi:hypothetical protein